MSCPAKKPILKAAKDAPKSFFATRNVSQPPKCKQCTPKKSKAPNFQILTLKVVGPTGFEPMTFTQQPREATVYGFL